MTISAGIESGAASRGTSLSAATRMRRGLLLAALLAGAGWAAHAASPTETADAVTRTGSELTRLPRFMAALKAGIAAAALAAVWWRLALPAGAGRLLAYLTAAAAAAAGPVLIWGMAHVAMGSLLLHGGLFAALALLWRDPAVAARLGALAAERRRPPSGRSGNTRALRPRSRVGSSMADTPRNLGTFGFASECPLTMLKTSSSFSAERAFSHKLSARRRRREGQHLARVGFHQGAERRPVGQHQHGCVA